jgi:hypothetical protein
MIEITLKELVGAAVFILSMVWGFGRMLLSQFEKRMDERFTTLNEMREARLHAIEDRLATENQRITNLGGEINTRITNLSSELNSLANLLPLRFVQRDDWIRFASQIDHKIDRLGELVTRLSMMRPIDHEQR